MFVLIENIMPRRKIIADDVDSQNKEEEALLFPLNILILPALRT
jgi:hypothetical protein